MSNTYCDLHKKKKSILFGNVTYCTECDKQTEDVREVNKDGFHIPSAPTFVEEYFYYTVLEKKTKWAKKPQYTRLCQDLSAATVEVKLKNEASMGKFKIAKVVTSVSCDAWLPSGISSPSYAIWNGVINTPPNLNGRHASLLEWLRPSSGKTGKLATPHSIPNLSYGGATTGRFSSKANKKLKKKSKP